MRNGEAMRTIELQFPTEDDSRKAATQAAEEEKQERAEEEHVEAVAAVCGETPKGSRSVDENARPSLVRPGRPPLEPKG